jgi:hypothetical protein
MARIAAMCSDSQQPDTTQHPVAVVVKMADVLSPQVWWWERGEMLSGSSMADVLAWLEECEMELPSRDPAGYPSWMLAQAFLLWLLTYTTPVPAAIVTEVAEQRYGLPESVLRAARAKLRIIAFKQTRRRQGSWWWKLPAGFSEPHDLVSFDKRWARWPVKGPMTMEETLASFGLALEAE